MKYISKAYTEVGGRTNNEDSYIKEKRNGKYLFAIADGLGGCGDGKTASQIALSEIKKQFRKDPVKFNLVEAIHCANKRILDSQEKSGMNMKTTLVAAYLNEDRMIFANVGDSRVYGFKNNEIVFQSIDHSVSQMAVLLGEITASQIRGHEGRNLLTRALGIAEELKVDWTSMDSNNIEAMLLCSDGFWEYVLEEDMLRILKHSQTPATWLRAMRKILSSNAPMSNDNNTAIAIIKRGG